VEQVLRGKALVPGIAEGIAVVSNQPISFWGGVDPLTGDIIDRRHERYGINITGKIFVFPVGKGSSTSSAVLMEGIRNGTAPAGIIIKKIDPILALGAIVSQEMYQQSLPIILLDETNFDAIYEADYLKIQIDAVILLSRDTTTGSI